MPDLLKPPVGFHFVVNFNFPSMPHDFTFMEVSGLNSEIEMESYKSGGQNRFTYQLPVRTKYEDLTLKRGMMYGSTVRKWVSAAFEEFTFQPIDLSIFLLDENHAPIYTWEVVNAIPKKWQVSNFNAQDNNIVVETFILSYHYFTFKNLISP